MQGTVRMTAAAGAVAFALALPTAAGAAHSGEFKPPPGCTGGWNTVQAAENNHAPGTSRGCAVAIEHV